MLITVELAYVFLMSSTPPFSVKPLEFKAGCSKKLEGRMEGDKNLQSKLARQPPL